MSFVCFSFLLFINVIYQAKVKAELPLSSFHSNLLCFNLYIAWSIWEQMISELKACEFSSWTKLEFILTLLSFLLFTIAIFGLCSYWRQWSRIVVILCIFKLLNVISYKRWLELSRKRLDFFTILAYIGNWSQYDHSA